MVSSVNYPLPTAAELPCSDDTPVDNSAQNLLPNLLLMLLREIWGDRQDWSCGVDMGIYHTTGANPRGPVTVDEVFAIAPPSPISVTDEPERLLPSDLPGCPR